MKAVTAYDLASRHNDHAEELYEKILSLIKHSANNGLFHVAYMYNKDDLIYHHYGYVIKKLSELGYECYFKSEGHFEINWNRNILHHGYPNNPLMISIFTQ